jgi:hypothetical protein
MGDGKLSKVQVSIKPIGNSPVKAPLWRYQEFLQRGRAAPLDEDHATSHVGNTKQGGNTLQTIGCATAFVIDVKTAA